jgi:hypothetical protein
MIGRGGILKKMDILGWFIKVLKVYEGLYDRVMVVSKMLAGLELYL